MGVTPVGQHKLYWIIMVSARQSSAMQRPRTPGPGDVIKTQEVGVTPVGQQKLYWIIMVSTRQEFSYVMVVKQLLSLVFQVMQLCHTVHRKADVKQIHL